MKRSRVGALGLGIALALSLSIALPAGAVSVVYYLDENNIGLTGGPWASVTLSDVTSALGYDGVHFVVDPIDTAFTKLGNFGLQSFFFNENTTFGNQLQVVFGLTTGWSSGYKENISQGFNAGGDYGKFEFKESGTGSTRQNPLIFDVFAPNASLQLSIANFTTVLSYDKNDPNGYIFAAHIADFVGAQGCEKSAKFATNGPPENHVPEPGSLLLLGSGLLGVGLMRRRKTNA